MLAVAVAAAAAAVHVYTAVIFAHFRHVDASHAEILLFAERVVVAPKHHRIARVVLYARSGTRRRLASAVKVGATHCKG